LCSANRGCRLDTEYADRARSLNFKIKPSDYFRRQGYVTYQQDQYLDPIIPLIGEDNIIWGADYPHPDCIWPDSQRVLEKNLAAISPSVRRKITCENVTRLPSELTVASTRPFLANREGRGGALPVIPQTRNLGFPGPGLLRSQASPKWCSSHCSVSSGASSGT
jgi:hypothetical protein